MGGSLTKLSQVSQPYELFVSNMRSQTYDTLSLHFFYIYLYCIR